MDPIARETFQRMPDSNKLDVLFDAMMDINKCSCETRDHIATLEKKVDHRKKIDTSVAAGTGLVGGFLAFLGSKLIK